VLQDDIKKFFQTIYGNNAPGFLTIWNRKNFRTKWFKAANLGEASKVASDLSQNKDVYFGIGLRKTQLDERKRGIGEDVIALPALWLDVDIYDAKAHVKTDLPHDLETAEELLNKFKLKPTITIHTGHGLNPLYLFKDLWIFKNENDNVEAKELSFNFNKALIKIFKESGYHLDNVGDLSRVIRIPYTTNFKTTPVPVKIINCDLESKYTLDEIKAAINEILS